jgi:hypothetical protein
VSESLATPGSAIPATSAEALEHIGAAEAKMRAMPQIHLQTRHVLHAGMYARTIHVQAGVAFISVLIKVPTVLIVHGHCRVFAGESWRDLEGYNVIPACAGRKMVYITFAATDITMVFPSKAKCVEEAERQFTDDPETLLSRHCADDIVTITGVEPCLE